MDPNGGAKFASRLVGQDPLWVQRVHITHISSYRSVIVIRLIPRPGIECIGIRLLKRLVPNLDYGRTSAAWAAIWIWTPVNVRDARCMLHHRDRVVGSI